eukprot:GEMP01065479.1.p1 GENE.GEMP01065479.1~~GEMP01065479.1.p1  ORF type:complete len:136 (+),score=24.26 GEMP01065479.1:178-585(+)
MGNSTSDFHGCCSDTEAPSHIYKNQLFIDKDEESYSPSAKYCLADDVCAEHDALTVFSDVLSPGSGNRLTILNARSTSTIVESTRRSTSTIGALDANPSLHPYENLTPFSAAARCPFLRRPTRLSTCHSENNPAE